MRYEVTDWNGLRPDQTSVAAASDASEHFYGFGEKFNSLDQAGKVVEIQTFDNPGNKGDRSYKVAPWFISTRGYGFHLDSTARTTFDMRVATGRYVVTNHAGTLAFQRRLRPRADRRPVPLYTSLTGRPPCRRPSRSALDLVGHLARRRRGPVRGRASSASEASPPRCSSSTRPGRSPTTISSSTSRPPSFHPTEPEKTQFGHPGTFEGVDFKGFADLAAMMTFFRENGLKVICWMTPFVNDSSNDEGVRGQNMGEARPDRKDKAFFVRASKDGPPLVVPWWKGRGSPIDFTKADARSWLSDRLTDLVKACMVDTGAGKETAIGGFKTDDGEFGNGTNTYIPETAVYSDGRTGKEFVNGYCVEYHKTVHGVLGKDGVLFARSGFTGSQAFPGCWAGDNEPNFGDQNGLPSVIVAGLSAAMSGFSIWGHDVGGYQNSHFSTGLARRPVHPLDAVRLLLARSCRCTGRSTAPTSGSTPGATPRPARRRTTTGRSTIPVLRDAPHPAVPLPLHLRQAVERDRPADPPPARPDPPGRPEDVPGPAHLLLRRRLARRPGDPAEGEPTATVYLPEGDWFDFWTNERHAGKQDITWKNPAQPDAADVEDPGLRARWGDRPADPGRRRPDALRRRTT